ncbi:hypothetical protein T439DRAFT_376408 [Meredithblackwellia eburnea MCA 4105]
MDWDQDREGPPVPPVPPPPKKLVRWTLVGSSITSCFCCVSLVFAAVYLPDAVQREGALLLGGTTVSFLLSAVASILTNHEMGKPVEETVLWEQEGLLVFFFIAIMVTLIVSLVQTIFVCIELAFHGHQTPCTHPHVPLLESLTKNNYHRTLTPQPRNTSIFNSSYSSPGKLEAPPPVDKSWYSTGNRYMARARASSQHRKQKDAMERKWASLSMGRKSKRQYGNMYFETSKRRRGHRRDEDDTTPTEHERKRQESSNTDESDDGEGRKKRNKGSEKKRFKDGRREDNEGTDSGVDMDEWAEDTKHTSGTDSGVDLDKEGIGTRMQITPKHRTKTSLTTVWIK